MRSENRRSLRIILPLAILVLIHAFGRYVGDPRPADGPVLRALLSLWFTALGVTYTLTYSGSDTGRKLLLVWGILTSVGFLADNLGIMPAQPPTPAVAAWNWVGVGLGMALAFTAYAAGKA